MAGEQELDLEAVIGFTGRVPSGLTLHPDNEHLIFPLESTVVVRNLVKRTQQFLQGHDNAVSCLTVSKCGRFLASGQQSHMGFAADVIVWDFESRTELHRLSLHKVYVQAVAFSHDSQFLCSLGGRDDNSLVVWDMKTGEAICGTPASTETAKCVSFFSTSSLHLLSAGVGHIRVWELDVSAKKVRPTTVKTGQLKRVAMSVQIDQNDQFALVGTESGDVVEVSLESALFRRSFPQQKPFPLGITAMADLENGDTLLGTGSGAVYRVGLGVLRVKAECQVLGGVTSISVTADKTHFFVGTKLCNVYWVDCESMTPELRATCHHERVNAVVFPEGYSEVFATASVADIRVWNAKSRQELLRIQVPGVECFCLSFSRDGRQILSGWSDGKVRSFLPQSGRLQYVVHEANHNGTTALAVSSDGSRLITGGVGGEVRVWRTSRDQQKLEASLKEHRGRIYRILLRKDEEVAVSASADGSCVVWCLHRLVRLLCLQEATQFKGLAYYGDESQMLSVGSDRKVAWWDSYDGSKIREVEGTEDGDLTALAISRNGSHFVTGGQDKMVKLYSYDMGVVKNVGVGHSGSVLSATFSPDEKTVVTVGEEGAVFVWSVPQSVQEACMEETDEAI